MTDRAQFDRLIHLRRPATLSIVDEPFVPDVGAEALDEVDVRWRGLCESNPAYFDGRFYHVFGVHRNGHGGAVIHVADCLYRYHAVQDVGFDVGAPPLGVKGVIERDGRLLLGKRSMNVAKYGGQWEFAPGGVVEPGETPAQTVLKELREETGLTTAGRAPIPIALLYDGVLRCWEVIFRIEAHGVVAPETNEYDALEWCDRGAWPGELTPLAGEMVRRGVV